MEVHKELCCLSTAGKWKRGKREKKEMERERKGEKGRGKTETWKEVRKGQSKEERLDTFS